MRNTSGGAEYLHLDDQKSRGRETKWGLDMACVVNASISIVHFKRF